MPLNKEVQLQQVGNRTRVRHGFIFECHQRVTSQHIGTDGSPQQQRGEKCLPNLNNFRPLLKLGSRGVGEDREGFGLYSDLLRKSSNKSECV